MKRITGKLAPYDVTYMCAKQFELINNLDCNNHRKKWNYIKESKKALLKRWATCIRPALCDKLQQ